MHSEYQHDGKRVVCISCLLLRTEVLWHMAILLYKPVVLSVNSVHVFYFHSKAWFTLIYHSQSDCGLFHLGPDIGHQEEPSACLYPKRYCLHLRPLAPHLFYIMSRFPLQVSLGLPFLFPWRFHFRLIRGRFSQDVSYPPPSSRLDFMVLMVSYLNIMSLLGCSSSLSYSCF